MRLIAILNWWDESPSWLAAAVASLARIGVDHLVAGDGGYFLYPDSTARSGMEQADTILRVCDALNIGCTMDRPQGKWLDNEREKRTHLFRLAEAVGTVGEDWLFIIDADDVITSGSPALKAELDACGHDAAITLPWQRRDPFPILASEEQTRIAWNISRNTHPKPRAHHHQQVRLFRLLANMRMERTHYTVIGEAGGVEYAMRGDEAGKAMGYPASVIYWPENEVHIEHLDPWRDAQRVVEKAEYYADRDASGVEAID